MAGWCSRLPGWRQNQTPSFANRRPCPGTTAKPKSAPRSRQSRRTYCRWARCNTPVLSAGWARRSHCCCSHWAGCLGAASWRAAPSTSRRPCRRPAQNRSRPGRGSRWSRDRYGKSRWRRTAGWRRGGSDPAPGRHDTRCFCPAGQCPVTNPAPGQTPPSTAPCGRPSRTSTDTGS